MKLYLRRSMQLESNENEIKEKRSDSAILCFKRFVRMLNVV